MILGTGVGGGLVVDGRVSRARNAIAGEWGHNPLPWPAADERPARRATAASTGCIETWLSGPALARRSRAATGTRPADAPIDRATAAAAGDAPRRPRSIAYTIASPARSRP